MVDIFLSYSDADRPIVRFVTDQLQQRGAGLHEQKIAEMAACDWFLLFYSPHSATDPQVRAGIIAALMQNLPVAVLTIRPSPHTLPDFPFIFEPQTRRFTMSAPEQVETALNGLASALNLPQLSLTPPDAALFESEPLILPTTPFPAAPPDADVSAGPEAADDADILPHGSQNLVKLLFEVSEMREGRLGAALTILLWLPRFATEHSEILRGYRDQQIAQIRTQWLLKLEREAQTALESDDDTQIETLIETVHNIDSLYPLSWQLQSILRERRTARLWDQIQAQAEAHGWASTGDLLEAMRNINPLDSRTLQAGQHFRSESEYKPLYELALQASTGGYSRAFAYLIYYIQQHYPNFTDTHNLLASLKISPELVPHLKPKHILRVGSGVQVIAFSPDSTLLVSGGNDGALRLWDIEQVQQVARHRRDDGAILSVAYSHDGMLLVSAAETGIVRLWQMPEGREVMQFDQFTDTVTSVCFTPDDRALICGGESGTLRIIRIDDGTILCDVPGHDYTVTSLNLSAPQGDDGHHLLLSSSEDRTVRVWKFDNAASDAPALTELRTLSQHRMIVQEAALSQSDPLRAASVGNDGYLCLWSPLDGELLMSVRSDAVQTRTVVFAPSLPLLATGGTDGSVTLWDSTIMRRQLHKLTNHEGAVNSLAFSPDGLWLASGSSDHSITLWHL